MDISKLPIQKALPELIKELNSHNRVILEAMPGAGKTTGVPLALLKSGLPGNKKIVMLEPRRIAARSTSQFMASQLGEELGKTVGYQVRFENFCGPHTKVEVLTEGILTRRIQSDPELSDVGILIFDEFHERNLQSDLALALALDIQENLREDLKILIMSATLDTEWLSDFFQNAPVIKGPGSPYPVELIHSLKDSGHSWFDPLKELIIEALDGQKGNILVFLPGSGEILRMKKELEKTYSEKDILFQPLYGKLSKKEQDLALSPESSHQRKVVLSTPIAETSVTIPGIKVVIDSGLTKVPFLDPDLQLTRLQISKISKAQAKQRAGRAGRLSPGVCYRPWSEGQHNLLEDQIDPEILHADLTGTVLELAQWGVLKPNDLRWPTPPPENSFKRAQKLLMKLDQIDPKGQITSHGKKVLSLGLHPRLGHMIVRSQEFNLQNLALDLAAFLIEKDPFIGGRGADSDLCKRLEALHDYRLKGPKGAKALGMSPELCQRIQKTVFKLRKRFSLYFKETLKDPSIKEIETYTGVLLGFAYTDRIAKRRNLKTRRYHLFQGPGAVLLNEDTQSPHDFIAIGELKKRPKDSPIYLSAPLTLTQIHDFFQQHIVRIKEINWNEKERQIDAFEYEKLGAITLKRYFIKDIPPEDKKSVLIKALRKDLTLLPWNETHRQWQERILCLKEWFPKSSWPKVEDKELLKRFDHWLLPFLDDLYSEKDLENINLQAALDYFLGPDLEEKLKKLAPANFLAPTGRAVPIKYEREKTPILPIKINEMYGQEKTPSICEGKITLTIHLLNPAGRPVQITNRLEDFWQGSYEQVRKELNRQYPKHDWPLNPLNHLPTKYSKKRKK
ncbi:ATP-dependent helicase HrpB [Bacteriovoracales bacterium]|nr:ATP-dependent helicase HrpB [Bacteriovoracales bacterium]